MLGAIGNLLKDLAGPTPTPFACPSSGVRGLGRLRLGISSGMVLRTKYLRPRVNRLYRRWVDCLEAVGASGRVAALPSDPVPDRAPGDPARAVENDPLSKKWIDRRAENY